MNTIGILTSGGDAPGMNAAIHSVVMAATTNEIACIGFERGFNGVLDNDYRQLNEYSVKHISHLGGTILRSARCKRLYKAEYQKVAANNLKMLALDGLVVIGGDGSFTGALEISKICNVPVVGIPATIDNDVDGCDSTLGFQTAVQTATEAIDKIRDTADALERIFIVEVMGRNTGFIALHTGIASEAEQIIYPEMALSANDAVIQITKNVKEYLKHLGHTSYIIVMAENSINNMDAASLSSELAANLDIECRAIILGHLQRGGKPINQDRILASKLGYFTIKSLVEGSVNCMVGIKDNELSLLPLEKAIAHHKPLDRTLEHIAKSHAYQSIEF